MNILIIILYYIKTKCTDKTTKINDLKNHLYKDQILISPEVPYIKFGNNSEDNFPIPNFFILEKSQEFAISTGSACNSGIVGQSHVLQALGLEFQNLRISI
jgi:cysteine sulfinate desulfinase/cysteine desulfurase-like protein